MSAVRSRALVVVATATMALLGVSGCDDGRRAISRDDLPEVPDDADAVVEIGDDGFDPDEIEVITDEFVEFRNVGEAEHGVRTDDYEIDTGSLLPGESTQIVFDRAGTFDLVDTTDDDHLLSVTSVEPATP